MFKLKHSLAGSGLAGLLVIVVMTFGCGHSPTAPSSVELTLNQVAPSTGPIAGGSLVRLYGTGFKAGTAVAVRGTTVETNVLSATQLSVIMPAGAAGPADLVVTNPDGKTAKLAGGYTY